MKYVAFAYFCLAALAQHQHPATPTEKPVSLLPGLGIWSHPIATRNPQAQKFFDQGMVMLYGFNRYEALRSFRKVLELDPNVAMAQWGISMALGPYVNMDMDPEVHVKESCDAANAGLAMSRATPTDRAWLQAALARCPDFADPSKYIRAMRELAAQYPDDPDAQTWYAEALMLPVRWRWYESDGKAAPGVEEAERVLEAVLRREPAHPGANHFYIHAVESSPTPGRAVPSAQRLMAIVPAAGHMVHMPGHIWLVLGDWNAAVDVNERAVQLSALVPKLDRAMPWGSNQFGGVLDLAVASLDARLESSPAAAIPKWRRAVEIQDGLVYDEPPAWYYPVRESLGAALLRSGDAVGAEAVFREGMRRSPNNGRMLFGLRESLKAQGKADAAAWVEREFQAAWRGSGLELRLNDF